MSTPKVKLTKDQAAALIGKRVTLQVSDRTVRENYEWGGKDVADYLKTDPTVTVDRHDDSDSTFRILYEDRFGDRDTWWAPVSWFKPADTNASTLSVVVPASDETREARLARLVIAEFIRLHENEETYNEPYETFETLLNQAGYKITANKITVE